MTLTPTEMNKLTQLQNKVKNYIPLTDGEIAEIEKHANGTYDNLPSDFQIWMDSWNTFCDRLSILYKENTRLLQDINYWKEKNRMTNCNNFKDGDKGQRFEIRFIAKENIEQVFGWCETKERAERMMKYIIELYPGGYSPKLIDRGNKDETNS